jgi:adenylate kinase
VLEDTVPGRQAKVFLDRGQHVPDEIVSAALKERFRLPDVAQGFLLAGFPRTTAQAEALDIILEELKLPIDLVLLLGGDLDQFMERLEGRRVCSSCGAMYNLFSSPSRVEGVCDLCGGQVRRRAEDSEETIASRMRTFDHTSHPLIQYYRMHGKLRQIQADRDSDQVFQALCQIIEQHPPTVIETEPVEESPVPLPVEQQERVDRVQEEGLAVGKGLAGKKKRVKKKPVTRKKGVTRKKAPAGKKASSAKKAPAGRKKQVKKSATRKKGVTRKKAPAGKKASSAKKALAGRKKQVKKKSVIRKKGVTRKKAPAGKKASSVKKAPAGRKKRVKKSAIRKKAPTRKKTL